MEKLCNKCKTAKPSSEFSTNSSKKDGLQTHCKSCRSKYHKEWYKANRELQVARSVSSKRKYRDRWYDFVMDYFKEHPCVDCGETDPIVLEFDHVRGTKDFNIATGVASRSWDALMLEIEKCDVRCANCHNRRTAKERGYGKAARA